MERLIAVTAQLDEARSLLRDLAAAEGDTSLVHMVAIWRDKALREGARADDLGTRMVLAERAVRRLVAKQPAGTEVSRWMDEVDRQEAAVKATEAGWTAPSKDDAA